MYVTTVDALLPRGYRAHLLGTMSPQGDPWVSNGERVEHETGIGRHRGSQGVWWSPQGFLSTVHMRRRGDTRRLCWGLLFFRFLVFLDCSLSW